jgi:hypothetical protein
LSWEFFEKIDLVFLSTFIGAIEALIGFNCWEGLFENQLLVLERNRKRE